MEVEKTLFIDDRYDSYESFFDHDWAKVISSQVTGTPLEAAVFNVCLQWKGTANTLRLPWLMVEGIRSFANGMCASYEPETAKFLSALRHRLVGELGEKELRNMQRRNLQAALDRICKNVGDGLRDSHEQFDSNQLWHEFLPSSEFRLSVWSSQQLGYSAVYFAYEDFVRSCVQLAKHDPEFDATGNALANAIKACFGDVTLQRCWEHRAVTIARRTRNALVHNGGKMNEKLAVLQPTYRIESGMIQLTPGDTHLLFDELKMRTSELVAATLVVLSAK